jgi:hypothetical protein
MFGLGRQKPRHYREMLTIAWANCDQLPFAWRILNDGVSSSMRLDGDGDVLLLPATTRYESEGGGHRDVDGTADHLLTGDSRTADRSGASEVARLRRGHRSRFDGAGRQRHRHDLAARCAGCGGGIVHGT